MAATLGLDLEAGARLAEAEMYGDWYRDPWGWPELTRNHLADADPTEMLGIQTVDGHYRLSLQPSFHLLDVPKTWLGVRPAVVMDARSRLAYMGLFRDERGEASAR